MIRHRSLLLTLVPAVLLAGCAGAAGSPAPSPDAAAVTLDNCGFEVGFDAAPERVLTVKSTATEMLLALGVGDRIVGTAFQDGPLPEGLAAAGADLVSVSDRLPSAEAVLELEPDLVYAGWESTFTPDAAGDRGELTSLGVASYVSPAACKAPGYQPAKLAWEDVSAEITEVGEIFGVPEAAEVLVAEQEETLAGIDPDDRALTALWWSSGTDTPYVGAGIGSPQLILDTIGLVNIAADVDDTWTSYSWEAVAEVDPDVLVLVDASWNSADTKKARLASDPLTANLTAVRNERYLVIPFAAGEAGVRSAGAAADLAAQLAELEFGD